MGGGNRMHNIWGARTKISDRQWYFPVLEAAKPFLVSAAKSGSRIWAVVGGRPALECDLPDREAAET